MFINDRSYLIISSEEIPLVDFNLIVDDSPDSLVISIDTTKSIIKWTYNNTPNFLDNLTTKEGPYTHLDILRIISTPFWSGEPDSPSTPITPTPSLSYVETPNLTPSVSLTPSISGL